MKLTAANVFIILLITLSTLCCQRDKNLLLKAPYLGQKPPGMKPEKFAPGIISTPGIEFEPVFSPDGEWIAYISDETGQYEIYVQPFPQAGLRYQLSSGGAIFPVWSPDGSTVYYRRLNSRDWMAVDIRTSPEFAKEAPRVIFQGEYLQTPGRSFDVSADGQRFLVMKGSETPSGPTQLNVVTNWFEELKRKVPTGN